MVRKTFVALAASLALVAAPTVAAAQSAPAQPASTEVAPAAEQVDGSEIRGGYFLPLAVIIAALVAGYFLFIDDEDPDSP